MHFHQHRDYVTVSLVLNGDWIITIPDPNNPGIETELTRFHANAYEAGSFAEAVMMRAAANAAVAIGGMLAITKARVCGHDSDARQTMRALVTHAGLEVTNAV